MVKFAKPDEKPFDPISNKLLSAIANPPHQEDEEPSPAPSEPIADAAEPKRESPKKTPGRSKRGSSKRPTLKVLTKQSGKAERLTHPVKCLFTPSEDQELRAMVARLAMEAGTKLTLSHLMRPYFDLLLHCEDQLTEELRRADVSRPVNDKTALAMFERQLAEVIHSALRKAPLLRAERPEAEE
jgi:hypothetical protein